MLLELEEWFILPVKTVFDGHGLTSKTNQLSKVGSTWILRDCCFKQYNKYQITSPR
jgi:hypothetical protein